MCALGCLGLLNPSLLTYTRVYCAFTYNVIFNNNLFLFYLEDKRNQIFFVNVDDLKKLLVPIDDSVIFACKSRNAEFLRFPIKRTISLPISFPLKINKEQLYEQVVFLSQIFKSVCNGFLRCRVPSPRHITHC